MLRAIDNQTVFEMLGTTTTTGYWLTDTLYAEPNQQSSNGVPLEGFPNISQSIRGKPAEKSLSTGIQANMKHIFPCLRIKELLA